MRIIGFILISIIMTTACTSNNQLPTQIGFTVPTTTLIPTQQQELATATLPENIDSLDRPSDSQTSATSTPINCDLQDNWDTYIVQRGDSIARIASVTGSTIDELTEANCLENPNRINIGQELYVPNAPISPTLLPTSRPSPTESVAVSTEATQEPTADFSVAINKTFASEIGFGLEFPFDWFVTESRTTAVENAIITSFEYTLGDEIPQNQWTEDRVSITVTVFKDENEDSLSDWTETLVEQFEKASNISEVLAPVALQVEGDFEGQSIDYVTSDDTVVRNYYFIINKHKVQLNIGGNFDLAVPVVNSLHATTDT